MAGRDVVVIGASSGGVEALMQLIGGLPADLPAAVLVVVHFPQDIPSALPAILNRNGALEAGSPEDGEPLLRGRVYVAPPGSHLLVEQERVRLSRGPRENRHRPSVDVLFRTAAVAYGPRVIGVILTGARDDGAAGLLAVKRRGGVAVVQDPDDALFSGMPESALRYVQVDHCLPLEKMPHLLDRLSREPADEKGVYPVPDDMALEAKMSGLDPTAIDSGKHPGELSRFTCPECSGPLYEIRDAEMLRYRCRVGHAYTADNVLDEKSVTLENALYVALNTLEESAEMAARLAARSREQQSGHAAARFEERARDQRRRAAEIRRVLVSNPEKDL